MPTQQLLIRLPDEVLRRLRARVAPRQRSAFVQGLIEQALPADGDDDPLYQAALLVEQDAGLSAEMAEWDFLAGDGIEDEAPKRARK